jgi:hypothetical protein
VARSGSAETVVPTSVTLPPWQRPVAEVPSASGIAAGPGGPRRSCSARHRRPPAAGASGLPKWPVVDPRKDCKEGDSESPPSGTWQQRRRPAGGGGDVGVRRRSHGIQSDPFRPPAAASADPSDSDSDVPSSFRWCAIEPRMMVAQLEASSSRKRLAGESEGSAASACRADPPIQALNVAGCG